MSNETRNDFTTKKEREQYETYNTREMLYSMCKNNDDESVAHIDDELTEFIKLAREVLGEDVEQQLVEEAVTRFSETFRKGWLGGFDYATRLWSNK